jgi:phosphohistidine phosphatase
LDIYLIQHAEAVSEKEDRARPISREGEVTMEKVAALAARLKTNPDFIYHSEKLRAKQTAEILARHLGLSDKLRERHGLLPLDPVAPVAQWLKEQPAKGLLGLAIVGHLPFLDKLASLLITGKEEFGVVSFQNGAIAKLVPTPDGTRYLVQSILTRQLAEQAQTNLR